MSELRHSPGYVEVRNRAKDEGADLVATLLTHVGWNKPDGYLTIHERTSAVGREAFAAIGCPDIGPTGLPIREVLSRAARLAADQGHAPLSRALSAYAVFSRPEGAIRRCGGIPYVPPTRAEGTTEDGSALYLRNPDLIDRGTTAHKDTQDALARRIAEHGLEPISPDLDDQQFDIAWIAGDTLHLCEVKSLTVENEESQLRLGLGQLLSYLHRTSVDDWEGVADIRGVLAVERPPGRSDWMDICTANGVVLTCPDEFSALFEGVNRAQRSAVPPPVLS